MIQNFHVTVSIGIVKTRIDVLTGFRWNVIIIYIDIILHRRWIFGSSLY